MSKNTKQSVQIDFKQAVLQYHSNIPVGKISTSIKSCSIQDLAYAYTPGVGLVCQEIQQNPSSAFNLTSKGNNVCVVSNGTAVLGLGNLGALAAKPVMEGKAMLMKKLAGINATELCIDETDPAKFIAIVKACAPSMGAINLEDIKAPECFEIERILQEQLDIPVFHDDQHGTAVVVAAAIQNYLYLTQKDITQVKLVANGAGAAMLSTLRLLCEFGLNKDNIYLFDSKGIVIQSAQSHSQHATTSSQQLQQQHTDQSSQQHATTSSQQLQQQHTDQSSQQHVEHKQLYAQSIKHQSLTLSTALHSADIFLGLSVANALKPADIMHMSSTPLILALSNPVPEILPTDALLARPDTIIATGRSDYPNQVNNCTCFPYLFRAALDCRATKITRNMIKACVEAIVRLTRDTGLSSNNIIPSTFDSKLPYYIVPAVIQAAIDDNVLRHVSNDHVHCTTSDDNVLHHVSNDHTHLTYLQNTHKYLQPVHWWNSYKQSTSSNHHFITNLAFLPVHLFNTSQTINANTHTWTVHHATTNLHDISQLNSDTSYIFLDYQQNLFTLGRSIDNITHHDIQFTQFLSYLEKTCNFIGTINHTNHSIHSAQYHNCMLLTAIASSC